MLLTTSASKSGKPKTRKKHTLFQHTPRKKVWQQETPRMVYPNDDDDGVTQYFINVLHIAHVIIERPEQRRDGKSCSHHWKNCGKLNGTVCFHIFFFAYLSIFQNLVANNSKQNFKNFLWFHHLKQVWCGFYSTFEWGSQSKQGFIQTWNA